MNSPLSRLRRLPPQGTTPLAGETPATAFPRGLLRGLSKGLAAQPLFDSRSRAREMTGEGTALRRGLPNTTGNTGHVRRVTMAASPAEPPP